MCDIFVGGAESFRLKKIMLYPRKEPDFFKKSNPEVGFARTRRGMNLQPHPQVAGLWVMPRLIIIHILQYYNIVTNYKQAMAIP